MTSDFSMNFPVGSLGKMLVMGKKKNASPTNDEWTTKLIIQVIVTLILVGVAVWMATECNTLVDYILAVAFPFNYIMIRLLAPCRS